MLVRELILELEAILKDHPEMGVAEVVTEGCDCNGNVGSVSIQQELDESGHYVYLMRSDDQKMGRV